MNRGAVRVLRIPGALLLFAALALWAIPAPVSGQARDLQLPQGAGTYPTGDLFIRNLDAVWTATGRVLRNTSILIRRGKIEAMGPDLSVPAGVRVVEGAGMTAIPGLVDEHSHTAMIGTNEGTVPVSAEVRVLDVLDPEGLTIYRSLSGGVTTARIMHGSANPIGGTSAVVKMRWGMDSADKLMFDGAPRFIKFALGENVTQKAAAGRAGPSRFPTSRQGVEALFVQAFTAAREYKAEWEAYRRSPERFRVPPRRDLRLETLVDVLDRRVEVHAHSYRADEILALMRVAERFGFKINVQTHVLEGYRVAREMAEHGAGGSTFTDWWHYKLEAFDAIPHNAAVMHRQGVLTAINSDISWLQAFMIYEFPKAVKWGGVSREDALRMLTAYPARMMHIHDRVGTLEVGKDGDVVLLNGDPFDTFVRVEATIVDGIVYYDAQDEAGTRKELFNPLPPLPRVSRGPGDVTDPRVDGGYDASLAPDLLEGSSFVLVGGTVHPVSRPPVGDGVVIVRAGRITAVGPASQISVPDDLPRIDVTGKHVYPGMMDPLTNLGIYEFGAVSQAADLSETGVYNPHVRAISAVVPYSAAINVARANGITSALVTQTSGVIQGTAGVVQLRGDTYERMSVRPEAALMVAFPAPRTAPGSSGEWEVFHLHGGDEEGAGGRSPYFATAAFLPDPFAPPSEALGGAAPRLRTTGNGEPMPTLEGERMESLVALFKRAQVFAASRTVAGDPTLPFEVNVRGGERVMLEALVPAVRGEMPVLFLADSEWQLRTLFLFLEEFPAVRGVVVGGTEAYRVAEELAARNIPVIITSAYAPTPGRDESILASYRNAALLQAAGVKIAFGTGSTADVRKLPYHAAVSVAFGLPEEEGLKAVTLNPAEILGLGDLMGSLEPGKRADILLTDGSPLQALTRIHRMFIGGVEVDPRDNKHDALYREFVDRR
jgi:imidazolonepropionase-like amidohydrolase